MSYPSLHLRGTKICPLNTYWTPSLLGNAELYFMEASVNREYFQMDVP